MIEKLDQQTPDFTDEHIANIAAMFPHCVTEAEDEDGNLVKAIDFDLLKQELSRNIVEGPRERYRIDWPGKRASLVSANTPITKTLRPNREESVDFDTTQNLYIEGDNLEALKLLQESYLGAIKMIYIDPPYNTGKDFVYKDNFTRSKEEELQESGQVDEEGGRLVANPESNGRFHSDWLSMMYPRLRLARNLLKDDGVIFISIDDNEVHNLRRICDEVFGEQNLIAQICHKARASISNDKIISSNHNHVLFYSKAIGNVFANRKKIGLDPDLSGFDNPDDDPRGPWKVSPVDGPGGEKKGNPYYEFLGVEGYFRYSKKTMEEKYKDDLIIKTSNGLQQKYFLSQAEQSRKTDTTWWDNAGLTSTATRQLQKLMDGKSFDTPKPVELIHRMLKLITFDDREDAIILDFFSGSATTAHATIQLNSEDGGNRKFIMVQLPEETDEKSEAYKAGYKTIAEIGKERIRRAGKKIKEENADKEGIEKLDIGFRVLKIDSSNMKDVYFTPDAIDKTQLDGLIDHIKPDRTPEDLLFGVLVDWGVDLTLPIHKEEIMGRIVYTVGADALTACFDDNLDEVFIKELASRDAMRVVFKESGFKDDETKINTEQIFKQLSPGTDVRVI